MQQIKVVVAGGEQLFQDGLRAIIRQASDLCCVAVTQDANDDTA